jgi:hypothetical protein
MTRHPPDGLSSGDELRLERMRRALAEKTGFQLLVLEVPEGPLRDAVLARVLDWGGKDGVPALESLAVEPSDDVDQVLLGHKAKAGVVLIGLDDARHPGSRVDRAFGALNWIRDQLPRALDGPLVLVLSPRGVAKLLGKAPDLATSRANTCRIGAGEGEPVDDSPEPDTEDRNEARLDPSTQTLLRVSTRDNVFRRLPMSLPRWLADRFPTIPDVVSIVMEAQQMIENARDQLPEPWADYRLRVFQVPLEAGAAHAWSSTIQTASAISPYAILAILLVARNKIGLVGAAPILEDAIRAVLEPRSTEAAPRA